MEIQVPKVPALLVHVDVETADSVGIGVTSTAVDAAVFVPVEAAEAEDREDACAASVGPKGKQSVSRDTVADYVASVLSYETCIFQICLTAMITLARVFVEVSITSSSSASRSIPKEGANFTPNGCFPGSLEHAGAPTAIDSADSK